MAILGFHFSGVYKEKLFDGTKTATIMKGERHFKQGEQVLVYLSDKPNLFDGKLEKRIGFANIKEIQILTVEQLTEEQAKECGSRSLQELINSLKKWYNSDQHSTITFIRFDLKLEE